MDKRLPLVLALCVLIMVGWTYLFPPQRTSAPAQAPSSTAATATEPGSTAATDGSAARSDASNPDAPAEPAFARVADTEERTITLEPGEKGKPGYYRAVFSNRGAVLTELRTGNFYDRVDLTLEERQSYERWTRLVAPVTSGGKQTASMRVVTTSTSASFAPRALDAELWTVRSLGPADDASGVEFTLAPGSGVTFVKRYTFVPGQDRIQLEFEVRNDALEKSGESLSFVLTPAACMPAESGDPWYLEPQVIYAARSNPSEPLAVAVERVEERGKELGADFPGTMQQRVSFVGTYNKYFAVLLRGADEGSGAALSGASWRRFADDQWIAEHPKDADRGTRQIVTDVGFRVPLPARGATSKVAFDVYAGPKSRAVLEAVSPDFSALLKHDLGYFSGIASVLLSVLGFFESITGNWGVAIILLTLSVRLLLFPINRRSQTAMARYQSKIKRLQPKIDEIKKKYANDGSRQRQEQAKLMQSEGAFPPVGGCLPIFLQIPVFIGLYRALGVSFDLRHAPFLFWIHDLSVPDRFMRLGFDTHLPLIGTIAYLNILPPLMVGLWIWQQKGMPVPADEQAARMQKMMMWMPVMMGFFLYNYAAGLSLYMITQSAVGIVEQKVIKKYWPVDDTELPAKKGFMARLMEAQQAQMKRMEGQRRGRPKRVGR